VVPGGTENSGAALLLPVGPPEVPEKP
jgi:hypothetical protein